METPATLVTNAILLALYGIQAILFLVALVVFILGMSYGIYDHNATTVISTSEATALLFIGAWSMSMVRRMLIDFLQKRN